MSKFTKVRFNDGTFGIRKRNILFFWCSPEFVDLSMPRLSWELGHKYSKDCRGSEERVDAVLETLTDFGTPV